MSNNLDQIKAMGKSTIDFMKKDGQISAADAKKYLDEISSMKDIGDIDPEDFAAGLSDSIIDNGSITDFISKLKGVEDGGTTAATTGGAGTTTSGQIDASTGSGGTSTTSSGHKSNTKKNKRSDTDSKLPADPNAFTELPGSVGTTTKNGDSLLSSTLEVLKSPAEKAKELITNPAGKVVAGVVGGSGLIAASYFAAKYVSEHHPLDKLKRGVETEDDFEYVAKRVDARDAADIWATHLNNNLVDGNVEKDIPRWKLTYQGTAGENFTTMNVFSYASDDIKLRFGYIIGDKTWISLD